MFQRLFNTFACFIRELSLFAFFQPLALPLVAWPKFAGEKLQKRPTKLMLAIEAFPINAQWRCRKIRRVKVGFKDSPQSINSDHPEDVLQKIRTLIIRIYKC